MIRLKHPLADQTHRHAFVVVLTKIDHVMFTGHGGLSGNAVYESVIINKLNVFKLYWIHVNMSTFSTGTG